MRHEPPVSVFGTGLSPDSVAFSAVADGWVIVGASGVTAAAALGGSLIGVWAQGRREHQQWQRNQRATVYAELVRLHGRLMLQLTDMNAADARTSADEVKRLSDLGMELVRQLMDNLTTLQVFGTPEVERLANEVGQQLFDEFHAADAEGRPASRETLTPKWQELALAIRADLGVKTEPLESAPNQIPDSEVDL
jgi:hypothetical protein